MKILALTLVFFVIIFTGCKKDNPLNPGNSTPPENLPAPYENSIVVSNVAELIDAVNQANASGNITIILKDGTYELNEMLYITADNVDFRSESENRDGVIIKGKGTNGSVGFIFNVTGKNFIVGNMTLGWVANHAIQIHGELDADNPLIHNVRFVDTGEQMLKVSFSNSSTSGSDNGIVQYCLFEYPSGVGPQFYIGGVDAHKAGNWQVRYNTFKNIRSPENDLAEHAIHFWSNSENTIVEGNTIINCDRGIGFGMGSSGHIGGIIKNNMVYTSRDVGIGLENAQNVKVYNNSVFTPGYSYPIEYRFAGTSATITNNLVSGSIQKRDNGAAELNTNCTCAESSWFVDPLQGNLHLNSEQIQLIDTGTGLDLVTIDFDKENRPKGDGYDIGADEAY